jgi:hypothetical protein
VRLNRFLAEQAAQEHVWIGKEEKKAATGGDGSFFVLRVPNNLSIPV